MPILEKKVKKMCENKDFEQKEFVVSTLTALANRLSKLSLKRISEEEIVKKILENTDKITFKSKIEYKEKKTNKYDVIAIDKDVQNLTEQLIGQISYPGIVSEKGNSILNKAFQKYIACIVLYGSNMEKFKIQNDDTKAIAIVNLLFNKLGSHRTLMNYLRTPSMIKKDLQKIEYEDTTLWRYMDNLFSNIQNRYAHEYFDIYNAISVSRVIDIEDNDEIIHTGIRAIDDSINPRIYDVVDAVNSTIDYMEENTELTRHEIIKKINDNINHIDIVKPSEIYTETEQMPASKFNNVNGMLIINTNYLTDDKKEELEESLRKEVLFFMGLDSKVFSARKQVRYVGYCRGVHLSKIKDVFKMKDNSFNKAVTAMFLNESSELKPKQVLGYQITTDLAEGDYDTYINTNLMKQVVAALGIRNKQLYEGLYDVKAAQKIRNLISANKKGTFDKLSSQMDAISHHVRGYHKVKQEEKKHSDEGRQNEFAEKESKIISMIDKEVKKSEKMIIQNILLPNIENLEQGEKQKKLENYCQYMITSREWFMNKTGFEESTQPQEKVEEIEVVEIQKPDLKEHMEQIQYFKEVGEQPVDEYLEKER